MEARSEMSTVRLTVREIPADVHEALCRTAAAVDRPLNWIILVALREYVAPALEARSQAPSPAPARRRAGK